MIDNAALDQPEGTRPLSPMELSSWDFYFLIDESGGDVVLVGSR